MTKIIEGHDFNPAYYEFTQEEFQKMAKAVGDAELEKKHQEQLQSICNGFLLLLASWNNAPRPGSILKKLNRVKKDTVRLLDTIHDLHSDKSSEKQTSETVISLLLSAAPNKDWASLDFDLLKLSAEIAALGEAAQYAILALPTDKGGSTKDEPLNYLVGGMDLLFVEITKEFPSVTYDDTDKSDAGFDRDGHNYNPDMDRYSEEVDSIDKGSTENTKSKPYTGKFINFLTAFLAPLGAHYRISNQGLGKQVQRILPPKSTR